MSMAGGSAGFESYLRGSWWDVRIKEQRSSMFLLSYNADKDEEMAWVPLTELRLSSRRGDGWDCYILKKGMDVSVLSKHPHSNFLNVQNEGLYDARIMSVARTLHAPGACSCKFSLQFFSVKMKTYTDGSLLDRILLTNEPETQVSISEVRILQKPSEIVSLQDVLDAHMDGMWIPFGRGCKDAYFLTETELSTVKRSRGAYARDVDHTGPAPVKSDEVLSVSAARVSIKNVDIGSNCNSPDDGPELDITGPGTAKDEYRTPKSQSGAPENGDQQQSEGYADRTSPQSINIKNKSVSAQDHGDDDESNGLADERALKRKRGCPGWETPNKAGIRVDQNGDRSNGTVEEGAPKKDANHSRKGKPDKVNKRETKMPMTRMRNIERQKVRNDPDVTSTPGLNKNLGQRHKGYTLEARHHPERTETIFVSSDDDDPPSEYKPSPHVRRPNRTPYNTRTREPRKPKTEEEQPISGRDKGPPPRKEMRSSLYGNRYLDSKNSRDQLGKRGHRLRNTSGEVLSSEFD